MMHPLYEEFVGEFQGFFFFEGTVSNFRITEGKQIFHKQMKECFVHHMDLSFGIDFVPYILNI